MGLPLTNGLTVAGMNRHGAVAAYTVTSSSAGTSSACWRYDNGLLTNLGTLGGNVCVATAINDFGTVVGQSTTAEGYLHPFVYANGQMIDIGVLSGVNSIDDTGIPWAINSSGAIVGQSLAATGETHAFLYEQGILQDIDPTALFSAALGINDAGQVTGVRILPGASGTAYRYQNGVFEDISAPGAQSSVGRLINQTGAVAGSVTTSAGQHAFLFSDGAERDLGTLGGTNSFPSGLNDHGQIAGFAFISGDTFHAVVANDGVLVDLGSLGSSPGDVSRARSINASGQVVGWTNMPDGTATAFFSTGAGMHDLRGLLTPDSTTPITDALYINDAGQIVATGLVDGRPHAFLLTPTSVQTELSVAAVTVRYGTRIELSATLLSASTPVTQRAVTFAIDGATVGTAITDNTGVARLTAPHKTRAGEHTVSAAFPGDELYASSSSTAMLNVVKARLMVTSTNATRHVGAANPEFAASYDGLVPEETPTVLDGALTFATSATEASPAGSYAITASGLSSPNYDISYSDGTLTVTYDVRQRVEHGKAARVAAGTTRRRPRHSKSGPRS